MTCINLLHHPKNIHILYLELCSLHFAAQDRINLLLCIFLLYLHQNKEHTESNQQNRTVFMGEVIGIDAASKGVVLRDRVIPYDFLVLATGARHSYFGKDE